MTHDLKKDDNDDSQMDNLQHSGQTALKQAPAIPGSEINSIHSISIIICCYNSEPRLHRVLNAIAQQKNYPFNSFEIIVVNNNSSDNTKAVAIDIISRPMFSRINCRVIDEPVPGLSAARERGFKESVNGYVLFCDDDNIMDENFVAHALQLIQELPETDIYGAWCKGEFEIPPPGWSKVMLSALAVGRPAANSGFMQSPVNGACMLVKKSTYQNLKNNAFQFLLSDRKGNVLTSGGDSELCYAVLLSGGKIYFSEKLFFMHLIPAERLQKKYFKKLYMIPATQDFTGQIYQWVLKNNKKTFNRFYFRLLFNYKKTLVYCLKNMLTTGNLFYYALLFKQRLSFLLFSIYHFKKVKENFYVVTALQKQMKKAK